MATTNPAPAAAFATRMPTPPQALRELRLYGVGTIAEWQALLKPLAAQVRSRDDALAARRGSAKLKRLGVAALAALAAMAIGWKTEIAFGVMAAIAGIWAAIALIRVPRADYAGSERVEFVCAIVQALAAIAPNGRARLAAQLDAARSIPDVVLARGSGVAMERGECEDAWLRGSLRGIPGLRLSWQATEWRAVIIHRKRTQRGKMKTKAKLTYASRLAARIDADHALFSLSAVVAPQADAEGVVDARKTGRGYTVRGWRERNAKIRLDSTDVGESLAALREKGVTAGLGEPASALISLMRLCEARLALRGTKAAS